MLKCDFNEAVLKLYKNRTLALVFSGKFAAYFLLKVAYGLAL